MFVVETVRVVIALMVLTEQVGSIVAAVRRANQCVHVVTCWLLNVENHARMVIELDQHHRAVKR